MKNSSQSNCKYNCSQVFEKNKKITKQNSWTSDEFNMTKRMILKGMRIKIIAQTLGRSESAVNKFVTRAGLRTAVAQKKIKKRHKNVNILEHNNLTIETADSKIGNTKGNDLIEKVIEYMIAIGYEVKKNPGYFQQALFYKNEEYLLNNKAVSKIQLIIVANKNRVWEGKKIFEIFDYE